MNGGLGELFWIFLIIAMVQPWFRQKMLESARLRLIHRIEGERKSRVILMVHRQETMSLLGFPLLRYIDMNDSEQVMRAIRLTDDDVPIDLVLHTPGGLVLASLQIARAIKDHKSRVTVHVPHFAMSGGTLIALSADEIVMDPHAVLGPVDPQLGENPAASLVKVVRTKSTDELDDRTLILADVAEKALRQIREEVRDLLGDDLSEPNATNLADQLSQGIWTHDYPIGVAQARELGLPVRSELPAQLYDLMSLFPQAAQQTPAVQYVPTPHREP